MALIEKVGARQILDSRGFPTVEVDVLLQDGSLGRAAIPSGASTGVHEAVELRDGTGDPYRSRFVLRAVRNVTGIIAPEVIGKDPTDQAGIDQLLKDLDGTDNKSRLGANAILGVSLACAVAAARHVGLPIYNYLGYLCSTTEYILPVPMMNILNGGKHAEGSTDFQEFMVVPFGFETFSEALWAGAEVYQVLKSELKAQGLGTGLGDEGGFAPTLRSNEQAVQLLIRSIERAGYRPGQDISLALDVAASELWVGELWAGNSYKLAREGRRFTSSQLIDLYEQWLDRYPMIVSIEDGLAQDDWGGWKELTARLGKKVQLVGDDLFVTNPIRLKRGIGEGSANAILIKLNQIGTLTETLQTMHIARVAGFHRVVSHRSGETRDTFMSDLVVATGAGQIKAGAPARGERVAKYNRLLRIEEELGNSARFSRAFR